MYGLCGAIGRGATLDSTAGAGAGWVPFVDHSELLDGEANGSATPSFDAGAGAGAGTAGTTTGGGATALTVPAGSTVAVVATAGLVTIGTTTGAATAGAATTAGATTAGTTAAGASAGATSDGISWVGTTTGVAAMAATGTATTGAATMAAPPSACAAPAKTHDANAATQTLVLTFIAASIPKLLEYDRASETNPNARSGLTRSTLAIGEVLTIQSGPRGQNGRRDQSETGVE